jgi:predicted DNA repair protein MutK
LDFSIEAFPPPGVLGILFGMLTDLMVGVIAGAVVLGVVKLIGKLRRRPAAKKPA